MSTDKWKKGEAEARQILMNKGYTFDPVYHDDNSANSMPDLRFTNGQFLEITHTGHEHELEKKNEMRIIETPEGGREKIYVQITEIHMTRNILREICEDKGPKYADGKTDLFIFVSREEMEAVKFLIHTKKDNVAYTRFMEKVLDAPFPNVFLCAWDYDHLKYNLTDPELLKLKKTAGGILEYEFLAE